MRMKNKGYRWLLLVLLFLASCSTTKNLPEGEILYTGIDKLNVVNEDNTPAGITTLEEL